MVKILFLCINSVVDDYKQQNHYSREVCVCLNKNTEINLHTNRKHLSSIQNHD